MRRFRDHPKVRRLRIQCLYYWRARRYWWGLPLWFLCRLIFLPYTLFRRLALRLSVKAEYKGIYITDFENEENSDPLFVSCTLDALRLIETHDPRRFRRIQRTVRYITDGTTTGGGAYSNRYHECQIDFAHYRKTSRNDLNPNLENQEDYRWCLAYYAATLIHEATHGHFYEKGMPYIVETRSRIERLCHREEEFFVARLSTPGCDYRPLIRPFDETNWYSTWHRSRWKEIAQRLCRKWEWMRQACQRRQP